MLPQPAALPTTTNFIITKSNLSTYTLPIGLRPNQFSLGSSADEVGRVVGSPIWIRYGANVLEPEPFIFYGQIKGPSVHTTLDAMQVAIKDSIKFHDGYTEYEVDGGDVEASEKHSQLIDVTVILFPKSREGSVV